VNQNELGIRDLRQVVVKYEPKDVPLDVLSEWIGSCHPGSPGHTAGMAEMERRRLIAETEAAKATKRTADYMLWSVIVALVTIAVTVIVALLH
jgi:hypothetical protein